MSMAYFENDNDDYGWEDELAYAAPPDPQDEWVQTAQFVHTSGMNIPTTTLLGSPTLISAYQSLLGNSASFAFDDHDGFAGTYYTEYQPGVPATTTGTYAGITRFDGILGGSTIG